MTVGNSLIGQRASTSFNFSAPMDLETVNELYIQFESHFYDFYVGPVFEQWELDKEDTYKIVSGLFVDEVK